MRGNWMLHRHLKSALPFIISSSRSWYFISRLWRQIWHLTHRQTHEHDLSVSNQETPALILMKSVNSTVCLELNRDKREQHPHIKVKHINQMKMCFSDFSAFWGWIWSWTYIQIQIWTLSNTVQLLALH